MKKKNILKRIILTAVLAACMISPVFADDSEYNTQKTWTEVRNGTVYICKKGGFLNLVDKCVEQPKTTTQATLTQNESRKCSSNFGGIEIEDGKMVIYPKCTSEEDFTETATEGVNKLSDLYVGVWRISLVLSIIMLCFGAIQLAASQGNPQNSKKAWNRIKVSLVIIACLGGIGTIVGLAMHLI